MACWYTPTLKVLCISPIWRNLVQSVACYCTGMVQKGKRGGISLILPPGCLPSAVYRGDDFASLVHSK